jgi:hypothetical protein
MRPSLEETLARLDATWSARSLILEVVAFGRTPR